MGVTEALLCRGAEPENFTLTLVAERQEVPISLAVTSDFKRIRDDPNENVSSGTILRHASRPTCQGLNEALGRS